MRVKYPSYQLFASIQCEINFQTRNFLENKGFNEIKNFFSKEKEFFSIYSFLSHFLQLVVSYKPFIRKSTIFQIDICSQRS